ncbi:hypothetical protein Bca52824_069809 [Brassica carinata]|uniref:Uncharacterized protein n=1 Tax=Brassica carinata TaxID=52824 RepID=A0A8X7Q390_BRACI|nr:hypothetical protein Bca52824_069809 [Brassica carinata]
MGLMVTSPVSESLLLLPPPPEPPPSVLPLDLLGGIPAPDPPDPPDPPDMFGESDLSSLPCLCFTLTAARSHLFNGTITACSVWLLLVPLRVKLVRHLLLPSAGCRSWIYDFVWGKHRFFSMFLSLFSKGMVFAIRLNDSNWDGTYLRFGLLALSLRNQSQQLPQYEDFKLHVSHCLTQYEEFRHLVCLTLPQYEVLLPQYEVVVQNLYFPSIQYFCMLVVFSDVSGILLLRKIGDGFKKANLGSLLSDLFVCPWWFLQLHTLLWLRISSQFQGSSKRCMITFVAKLLAAFYAFVAAACSGSSSPSVASDSRGVISPISTRDSLLSCLCVMFAYIYVYVTCFACDAAVSLASLALLYYLLNDYSFDGV